MGVNYFNYPIEFFQKKEEDNLVLVKHAKHDKIKYVMRDIIDKTNFQVTNNDIVVIKPNLCDFRPHWQGCTTNPQIIEALIDLIRETSSPKIIIVESNHWVGRVPELFQRLGYNELAERKNVELVNLSANVKSRNKIKIDGYYFDKFDAPEVLVNMTKFISVAKLKTHVQHKITGIAKNQFGLIPQLIKSKYHESLDNVLLDLNETFKPDLCIVDGIFGMEGAGPSDGDPIKTEIIIGGKNYFFVDWVMAKTMRINPKKVPVLSNIRKKLKYNPKDIVIESEVNLNKLPKFKFIPWYSYKTHRFALYLKQRGKKISVITSNINEFLKQIAMGFVVIRNGRFNSAEQGLVSRGMVFRYGIGLLYRPFILFKFLPFWKKIFPIGLFIGFVLFMLY